MINDYEATQPIAQPAEPYATDAVLKNDDVVSTLNGLISVCKDGQDGFKEAAEGIEDSGLKSQFYEFSQQRAEFVGVLQGLVRDLGSEPETGGTISGAVHRGWIDIKSAIMGKDTAAILNECERGEDHAKAAYLDAEKLNLPANIADVIHQQSQAIQVAHNKIRDLRNNATRSASSTF